MGGHFEFVELAVRTKYRCQGLGLRLHDSVLEGVHGRCLLGTSDDPDDPAVRLYLLLGWTPAGPLRPRAQVMGRRL